MECNEVANHVRVQSSKATDKVFGFDRVLPETASQADVFEYVSPLVDHALGGLHATVFAYGQTGSGKTHTMEGIPYDEAGGKLRPRTGVDRSEHGVIPRVVEALFDRARQRMREEEGLRVRIKCSFMQIYNERVTDLLNPAASSQGLRIRWSRSNLFTVENLFVCECDTAEQVRELFFTGARHKTMGTHAMNQQSSRSHCIFTLYISTWDTAAPDTVVRSEMSLVDLAGSERLGQLGEHQSAQLVKESIDINASLLTLGKVITALASKAKAHIPYRDSKLTRLLQHALGGNSMTVMIACINPLDDYADETASTLLYAGRARNITNDPHVNEDPRSALIRQLRQEIASLKEELELYRQMALEGGAAPPSPAKGHGDRSAAEEDLAGKLIDSCQMLKKLIGVNAQLREAFDKMNAARREQEQRDTELQAENLSLRERIEVLESIVLEQDDDGDRPQPARPAPARDAVDLREPAPAPAPARRPLNIPSLQVAPPARKAALQQSFGSGISQRERLRAYQSRYRGGGGGNSYEEYYGVAKTQSNGRRQLQVANEVESLLRKIPQAATFVPQSLQAEGRFGTLSFGGSGNDVSDFEQRRRQREARRRALDEQHRRLQQGSSAAPATLQSSSMDAAAVSATRPASAEIPAAAPGGRSTSPPRSQGSTAGGAQDLFRYLSTTESSSTFTPEQLQLLRRRQGDAAGAAAGMGAGLPPGFQPQTLAEQRLADRQLRQQYQRELTDAHRLVASFNVPGT